MGGMGLHELLTLMLIIAVLSTTGLWPRIIQGLRELRGEKVSERDEPPPSTPADYELCYRILGISPSSTWEEIERAYRAKAKVHHPDHGGDEDAMRALNEAYARLKRIRRRPPR